MRVSHLLIVLILLVCGGVAGYFHFQQQQIDPVWQAKIEANLSTLLALDAQINEVSMKSRHALNNYDRLAELTRQFDERNDSLINLLENSVLEDDGLASAMTNLDRSIESKQDILENFKSHNSLLRNSIRYAPIAGKQLYEITLQQKLPDDALSLRNAIDALLSFALIGDEKDAQLLGNELGKLSNLDSRLPADAQETALEFLNHSKTVIKEKKVTDSYLGNLLTSPTLRNIVDLGREFTRYIETQKSSLSWLSSALIIYALVLSLVLIFLVYQLRRLYRHLDDKVRSRTEEIRTAYESLKESQQQLIHSEKMASLGQMVAGVAHEINTPLGYVSNNMNIVCGNVVQLDPLFENLQSMNEELSQPKVNNSRVVLVLKKLIREYRRVLKMDVLDLTDSLLKDSQFGLEEIDKLIRSLREYSRADQNKTESIDVNENLQSALRLCKVHLKKIKVNTQLGELPEIQAAGSRISQLFVNLITNAAQAQKDNTEGLLTITTRLNTQGQVNVTFEDKGIGISQEHLDKIFDPFFTTKEVGEGTGLGLSIAYKIARAHQGDIQVTSIPGEGAIFTVILPVEQSVRDMDSNEFDLIQQTA